jgi:hypothetical protein
MARGDEREEGFLERWARRKREAGAPEPVPAPAPVPVPAAPAQAAPEPEPVEPPSLDLVDQNFDLAHWLKQNVPESWKLAALRRAWESDPAIAGYLDPARDYALDWNTPGGAPGYGPLSESDNVEEMLANIFGKPPAEPEGEAVRNNVADAALSSNDGDDPASAAAQRDASGPSLPAPPNPVETQRHSPENGSDLKSASDPEAAAVHKRDEAAPSARPLRRRGGAATPL